MARRLGLGWLVVLLLASVGGGPGCSSSGPATDGAADGKDAAADSKDAVATTDATDVSSADDATDAAETQAIADATDATDADVIVATDATDTSVPDTTPPVGPCMVDLAALGADSQSVAVAVNDLGAVAALSSPFNKDLGYSYRDGEARVLAPGRDLLETITSTSPQLVTPRAINAAGVIVGSVATQPQTTMYPTVPQVQMWNQSSGSITAPTLAAPVANPAPLRSEATAINDLGQVIGWSRHCGYTVCGPPDMWRTRAFFWKPGQTVAQDLGSLGGISPHQAQPETTARALNAKGQVVGESMFRSPPAPELPSSGDSPGPLHAFLWDAGAMTDLGTLGGATSSAWNIDDDGVVFGIGQTADGVSHVFRRPPGGAMQDLGVAPTGWRAFSPKGHVIGNAAGRAYLWVNGTTQDLGTLGGATAAATAVNAAGQVVGSSTTASGATHAFLWTAGVMRDLGTLGGAGSRATAISPSGGVVGGASQDAAGKEHAFLWKASGVCPATPLPAPPSPPAASDLGRLIAPPSTSTVTSRQPTLRWQLPAGASGARVRICRDRACAMEVASIDATGSTTTPAADLPVGTLFWNATWRVGTTVGTAATPLWTFSVRARSAAVDTAWGTSADFNGDGKEDFIARRNALATRSLVYLGGATLISGAPAAVLKTPAGLESLGATADVGDVNGDGYADAVAGDPAADRAYLYLGGSTGLGSVAAAVIRSPFLPTGLWYQFATTVAAAGDVNRDGYGDVIVGTYGAGQAVLYFGDPSGLSSARGQVLTGTEEDPIGGFPHANFGSFVAGAGDVNGDGYADVAVAGRARLWNLDARTYVYLGGPTGLTTPPAFMVRDGVGVSLESISDASDVDGDGYAEVALAFNAMSEPVTRLYRGGPSGTSASSPYLATQGIPWSSNGSVVVTFGDFDADGFDDLTRVGDTMLRLAVQEGGATGPGPATVFTAVVPPGSPATTAFVSAKAGDFDGDGFDDLILTGVSAPTNPGALFVLRGSAGGLAPPSAAAVPIP